jgi:hypothetical protein
MWTHMRLALAITEVEVEPLEGANSLANEPDDRHA